MTGLSLSDRAYTILSSGEAMTASDVAAQIPNVRTNSVSTALWLLRKRGDVIVVGRTGRSGLYLRADKTAGKPPEWHCDQYTRKHRGDSNGGVKVSPPKANGCRRVNAKAIKPAGKKQRRKTGAHRSKGLRKDKIQLLDRLIARSCGDAADLLMNIRDDYL